MEKSSKILMSLIVLILGIGYYASFKIFKAPAEATVEKVEKKYTPYSVNINQDFEYWYIGEVVRVIDGDTIEANIGLGLDVTIVKRLRLAGINAPEMKDAPNGEKAKQYLESLVTDKSLIIKTMADDTDAYGRTLATIFVIEEGVAVDSATPTVLSETRTINVNEEMVKNKQAVIY